jgi:hypothetical protein
MSLLDCMDGLFMSVAYDWAFLNPVRKVYYSISITGLSVAIAFLVGTIELGYWRIAKVEDRWTPAPATEPESPDRGALSRRTCAD